MARVLCNPSSPNKSPRYGQRIIFTGPDGVGDYRTKQQDFPRSIGIGPLSPESTGDLNYLLRAAPGTPPPGPKHCYAGGVGWGVQYSGALNGRTLLSDNRIKRGEFRSAMEDRITHRFQNPWFEPPRVLDRQPRGARAWLGWTHSQEETQEFLQLNRKRSAQRKVIGRSSSQPSSIVFPQIIATR
ncbi:protein SPMIP2 [Sardina pilchardus]|uniref:protein SPMIP2 n=1 Tax=Sardina pilchardus TaxID=27697 RepID=UPI002E0F1993